MDRKSSLKRLEQLSDTDNSSWPMQNLNAWMALNSWGVLKSKPPLFVHLPTNKITTETDRTLSFRNYFPIPNIAIWNISITHNLKGSRMGPFSGDFERGGDSERNIPYFSALYRPCILHASLHVYYMDHNSIERMRWVPPLDMIYRCPFHFHLL